MSLNDRLRASVEAARKRQADQEEQQAQLTAELTEPEDEQDTRSEIVWDKLESEAVADIDQASDARVERMLIEDEAELSRANRAADALALLWFRAGPARRALALTALRAPLMDPSPDESHLCLDLSVVCKTCLADQVELLPDRAAQWIQLAAQAPPLTEAVRQEIRTGKLMDRALALAQESAPELLPVTQPDGSPLPGAGHEVHPGTGTLAKKLADLMRES